MSVTLNGPVRVVWGPNDIVQSITYGGQPLLTHIGGLVVVGPSGLVLATPLLQTLTDLLNTIASTPPLTNRRKVTFADQIFGIKLQPNPPNPPNPKVSLQYWTSILPLVWSWEDANQEVHKGTLYYLMAEEYLSLGDIASAYTCLFKALEEDKRTFQYFFQPLTSKPAYLTSSLVNNPNNSLYPSVVIPLRNSLFDFMTRYNHSSGSTLSLGIIDQKFLQVPALEDVKRFFVATFHEIFHLMPINTSRMINNDYSKLKAIDTLFNLGLIVDQILEYRFLRNARKGDRKMSMGIYKLALRLGWTTKAKAPRLKPFLKLIRPDPNRRTPDKVVKSILDKRPTFDRHRLDHKMKCVIIAYHLRNFGGHHIEGQDILVKRYAEILEYCIGAIFVAIEAL